MDPLSPIDLGSLRVLVTHDWLVTWAGAERVLSEIMKVVPQADLVVAVRTPDMAARNEIAGRARETRSEERRVGKECGYQCRSRWSPYH